MAVAHDAGSESHLAQNDVSVSEDSFSWTHTPVGTPRGVLVFVMTYADADYITSVTYGGSALAAVTGGEAADTAGEPLRCTAFFLGSSIPTGAQTVLVTRTNNATNMYAAAATVTASSDTAVHEAGIVLLQGDGALAEQNVDDGSPGSSSVRYAGIASGSTTTSVAGANSTSIAEVVPGAATHAKVVRETVAGQGSRPVGAVLAGSDDRAAVHLAIKETAPATDFARRMMVLGVA